MSTAPADLVAWAADLKTHGARVLGIVGDASHRRGYKLGVDRLDDADYSLRTARDRRGATIDASAIDIAGPDLVGLGRHLYRVCAGGLVPEARDVRELIAERSDGSHLWRWDAETGRTTGDPMSPDPYHHLHASTYRDSRSRSKIPLTAGYYEVTTMHPLYGTGGRHTTLAEGTPVFDEPDGRQVNTIRDERAVYRIAAEVRLTSGTWWLLDGGGDGVMRYVRQPA